MLRYLIFELESDNEIQCEQFSCLRKLPAVYLASNISFLILNYILTDFFSLSLVLPREC
jgi:hypothetical protein